MKQTVNFIVDDKSVPFEMDLIKGDTLFECGKCKKVIEMHQRRKVPATPEEAHEERKQVGFIPEIDLYRYEWDFPCFDCLTLTTVRTEIDRY